MEKEQGALHGFLIVCPRHINCFPGHGVLAGMEHGGGESQRGGVEVLDLLRLDIFPLQVLGQLNHVLQRTAGVAADEVFHNLLGLSGLFGGFLEPLHKPAIGVGGWLSHQPQDGGGNVFRGNFQASAHMVGGQLGDEAARLLGEGEVEPDAAGDKDVVHFGEFSRRPQEFELRAGIGFQVGTKLRGEATGAFAIGALASAPGSVHVCRGAAKVAHGSMEVGCGGQGFDLGEDVVAAPRNDGFALVGGDGAEGAGAVTAAVGGDGILDHVKGGNPDLSIGGMGAPGEGEAVERVKHGRG